MKNTSVTDTASLAAALIAVFEGERLTAYQDTGGVWTIGIGHTGSMAKPGTTITHEDSAALFKTDAFPLFSYVERLVEYTPYSKNVAGEFFLAASTPYTVSDEVPTNGEDAEVLSPHRQAALVSFAYNCGLATLKAVISGRVNINEYVHDRHGNTEPGLVARRRLESALSGLE